MAIVQVWGTYHDMPVIFHQENGQTLKITPGNFCPACHDPRYLDVDEGFRECRSCGRCYCLPSQRRIDAVSQEKPQQ
jgi:hypothetical protein